MLKKIKMQSLLCCSTLFPLLILTLVIILTVPNFVKSSMQSQVRSDLQDVTVITENFVNDMPGEFTMEDGRLCKNGIDLNTYSMFSEMSGRDIEVTLFSGDTRVATTLRDSSGQPIVGTKASSDVIQKVLNGQQEYFSSDIEINGEKYYGYYKPIVNGICFAGTPCKAVDNVINTLLLTIIVSVISVTITLFIISFLLSSLIARRIKCTEQEIINVANGDLTSPILARSTISEIASIEIVAENLRNNLYDSFMLIHKLAQDSSGISREQAAVVRTCNDTLHDITGASDELAQTATGIADSTQTQQDSLTEIVTMITHVSALSSTALDKVGSMKLGLSDLLDNVVACSKLMEASDMAAQDSNESVHNMRERVKGVSEAADAIIGIASDTRLLSLNASIEAAQAGERGRGFAVVADAIKGLAEKSDAAAKNIQKLLDDINNCSDVTDTSISKLLTAIGDTSKSLSCVRANAETTVTGLAEVSDNFVEIDADIQGVTQHIEGISNDVSSLAEIAVTNAAASQETSASIETLSSNVSTVSKTADELYATATELDNVVNKFTI